MDLKLPVEQRHKMTFKNYKILIYGYVVSLIKRGGAGSGVISISAIRACGAAAFDDGRKK